MLLKNCRGLRHETCVLALECLGYASAPAVGDGLRRWIGEDILFTILQSKNLFRDHPHVDPVFVAGDPCGVCLGMVA